MSRSRSSVVRREVETLFRAGALGQLTDGQLLERFSARRDAAADCAFSLLIERHGPMVLGVCHRILHDPHDVEDAFQATFLVLVRKAKIVSARDSLGRWLYGVSRRVALQAKKAETRRRARAVAAAENANEAARISAPDPATHEVLCLLEEAVAGLPEKYRAVVLLCDLGGMTHEVAARRLGCPVGTVESRLFRARRLLKDRLGRLGVTSEVLAVAVPTKAAAGVPAALRDATTAVAIRLSTGKGASAGMISTSVSQLMKGALRIMFWEHWKIAATLLLSAGVLTAGARGLVGQEREAGPTGERPATRPEDQTRMSSVERRLQELERRLDAALGHRKDVARGAEAPDELRKRVDPGTIRRVRPRFECLVEKVCVAAGQEVKKGDPLFELFSADLASAKNEYLSRNVQWQHDRRLIDLRKKLHNTGSISEQLWIDSQNEEDRSRLETLVARDRLLLSGLSEPEIEAVKDEEGERKAHFTLRAPVDGTVVEVLATPDDLAGPKDALVVIAGATR